MKVTEKEFRRLLKKYSAKKIIYKHTDRVINLTSKQIEMLIELKNRVI